MGTFIGHVAPGGAFCLIGLWHLFNTLRNYAHGWQFESKPWFPAKLKGKLKYMELYLIIIGSCLSIAGELHFGLHGRHMLDDDWSIPWMNLNNFEHSSVSLFFLIFATASLLIDLFEINAPFGFLHLLGAIAFSQELLIFHLHSADHMGLEGRYHWLLQLIIVVSMASTLLEILSPHEIIIPLVRSMSILFQGVWFIQMGFIVFTPTFVPKGCAFQEYMVICEVEEALIRAKALASLQFAWWLAGVVVLTMVFYVIVMNVYAKDHKYEELDQYMARSCKELAIEAPSSYVTNIEHSKSFQGSHISMEELPSIVPVGR